MRPYILKKEMISFVSRDDYDFDLQHLSYLNKLPAFKKRETLSLTRIEYECLKKIITGLEQTHYKHKQEYINWFSQHCSIADPVVTELDTACFKKKISKTEKEAQVVVSNLTAPSVASGISRIPYESKVFLDTFKKQYRKERPWYGIISEKLGLGLLSKLKKQSTDAAIEYLKDHAKKDAQSTTARTLNSLLKQTDFIEAFKKQYRKERPWYGSLTEFFGMSVINKLNDRSIHPSDFLQQHAQEKSESTTAKTLASLDEFAAYGGGALTEKIAMEKMNENIKPVAVVTPEWAALPASPAQQLPISSDSVSVEALTKAREFSFGLFDLQKKEVFARSGFSLDNLSSHENGVARILEHEKIARAQKEKQQSRSIFLSDLEKQLKVFWFDFDPVLRGYIEVTDPGVRKIQCHLYFNDEKINGLSAFIVNEEVKEVYERIQLIRVLYDLFCRLRNALECVSLSDEQLIKLLDAFMAVLKTVNHAKLMTENLYENLLNLCDHYQVNFKGETQVVASSCTL